MLKKETGILEKADRFEDFRKKKQNKPKEEDELFEAYNESFQENPVDFSTSITIGLAPNYSSDAEYEIGSYSMKNGKPSEYEIFEEELWIHVLRFIHRRINLARGSSCLINLRTMSRWIISECNIKSLVTIESAVIDIFEKRFGVSVNSEKEPKHRGFKDLRNTMKFWGTLGGKGSEGKKRLISVYQVEKPEQLLTFINKNVDMKKFEEDE